ncbi:MAG: hypothetical protein QHC67_13695 [Sphingobium sp.]|uniref:hypothetical protein n=1 Tax=Sphingobium sp. TaxID=1912891 RepID=UPI0029A2511B|nr:hypothetical protein [Sphingobium sp.]MDX3910854.1 hypothetical protein [Sphingobium sp.]
MAPSCWPMPCGVIWPNWECRTLDGHLIAIDARFGRQVWSPVTVEQTKNYTITGAPHIAKGKVMIGNGGAEYGARGYVSAYDAETGTMALAVLHRARQAWHCRWCGLRQGAREACPVSGGSGGGTVWHSIAYDPETDLLFVGVGNTSYWPAKYHSPATTGGGNNDNLFIPSIIALRRETESTCGTIRPRRATNGTILQRSTGSSPISRSTEESARC